jgi:glycosyltransferase involved in cell wall biosynthesis
MNRTNEAKKLLFLVRDSRYFLSHRSRLAMAALNAGYEVGVACAWMDEGDAKRIQDMGLTLFETPYINGCKNKGSVIRSFFMTCKAIQAFQPTIIHAITIRPILIGAFFNVFFGKAFIALFAGLGTLFRTQQAKADWKRNLVYQALFCLLTGKKNQIVFMNEEDMQIFADSTQIPQRSMSVIKGSGVELHKFPSRDYQRTQVKRVVVMASRLLRDKGVEEYFQAASKIRAKHPAVDFLLAGDIDPTNPTSLTREEVKETCEKTGVTWLGHVGNIPQLLCTADIYCLPSYHEGLSLSLLEASAANLAIVATDIGGCRAAVTHGKEAILIEPRNHEALATAIEDLLHDPAKAFSLARSARQRVEAEFTVEYICSRYLNLYASLS